MIKEALEYIVKMSEREQQTCINGNVYSNKEHYFIDKYNEIEPMGLHTLTSLVEYIKARENGIPEKMFINIVSPDKVVLLGHLTEDNEREKIIEVKALLPEIAYGTFVNQERCNIALQSNFIHVEDWELVMKVIGNVEAGTVANYSDDGMTQRATLKSGITTKQEVIVPNPVTLRPYRTFLEVTQPASLFIFRIRQNEKSGAVEAAVFEADGGAWKLEAIKHIKDYLETQLREFDNIQILA